MSFDFLHCDIIYIALNSIFSNKHEWKKSKQQQQQKIENINIKEYTLYDTFMLL